MAREAERLRRARGDHRRPIADDDDAVEGAILGGRENGGYRRCFVVEANRDGAVLPGIVDQVTAIGCKDELHAKSSRSLAKRTRLVARRRRQYEDSHVDPSSSHE